MENIEEKTGTALTLDYGVVTGMDGAVYRVRSEYGIYRAVRAAGCLLMPGQDDKVLVSYAERDTCYILSVLERSAVSSLAPAVLGFDGGVRLVAGGGDVEIESGGRVTVSAAELEVRSNLASAVVHEAEVTIGDYAMEAGEMKIAAGRLEEEFGEHDEKVRYATKTVTEFEEVESKNTRFVVEGTLTMQTKNTVIQSDENVRVDCEQIQLG